MTSKQLEGDRWLLSFSEPEAIFIINIMAWLGRHYREDVSQMTPALRAYWQGTITREDSHRDELKESQEVLSEARAELRSERLELVETWLREFELAEERDPWRVEISSAERDEFVSMLNDRRMLLALELGITQHDMEADVGDIPNESLRASILEIDVLGHFILVMLGPQIYRP
jgi:hypothetical protein